MSNRVFKRIQCEVDSNNLVYQRNSRDITLSNEKILIKIFRGDNKYKYLPSSYLNKRVIYDLDMTNLEYMASKGMFNLIKLFIEEKNEEYIKNIISSSPYTMKEAIASGNMFLVEYLFNKGFRAEDGDLSSMVNTYERNIVYAYDLYCELCDEFEEAQQQEQAQENTIEHNDAYGAGAGSGAGTTASQTYLPAADLARSKKPSDTSSKDTKESKTRIGFRATNGA